MDGGGEPAPHLGVASDEPATLTPAPRRESLQILHVRLRYKHVSRPRRSRLRATFQAVAWTLLSIALLGPHTHWSVCLTGACNQRTTTATATQDSCGDICRDCCHAAPGRARGGDNGEHTCKGCCVDLAIALEEAPLPRAIDLPPIEPQVVAVLPLPAPALPVHGRTPTRLPPHATGPPRPNPRTELIATTILRQ